MNKEKLIEVFTKHAKKFDFDDPHIRNKYRHSLEVAQLAYNIGQSLALNEQECMLCYCIGILHDYYRFEQWTKYKTFIDAKSVDHGDKAVEELFDKNEIEQFGIDPQFYQTIKIAIKNHNKLSINTSEIKKLSLTKQEKERLILFSKIIRDADKIELFGMMKRKETPIFSSDFEANGFSELALKDLKNKQLVNAKNVKTILDCAFMAIGLMYDLNFDYSKKYAKQIEYPQAIYDHYSKVLNEQDKQVLKEQILELLKTI